MIKTLGIIPARYSSTRFPGKPLIDIAGKSMIQRVYEQCLKAQSLSKVVVATDDQRIFEEVRNFDGHVIMTNEDHQSGTDRCFEALSKMGGQFDYIVNIQGDEPMIDPEQIDLLADLFDGQTELATLVKRITDKEDIFNSNVVKVVLDKNGRALLFSRSTIPHVRNFDKTDWMTHGTFYKHIGIYGYRSDILSEITKLPPSDLEIFESLEQLRWLENGYSIRASETQYESIGIDTPEDLEKLQGLI